jgi:hypothetical protein
MMDRERKERERQEIFEATWRSYRTAMENAFALQERTLKFAWSLLEAPVEALRNRAESNRATLDSLAEQSRKQREALENLVRESTKAYVNLLQAPFSYYQEVVEAMTAPWVNTGNAPESRAEDNGPPLEAAEDVGLPLEEAEDSSLPLEDYDSLNVRQVSEKLDGLSAEEIRRLRDHEAEGKNRQTLMKRFNARIESGT